MKHFILVFIGLFLSINSFAQNSELEIFVKNYHTKILKSNKIITQQKDIANGFISFCPTNDLNQKECDGLGQMFDVAIWKTDKKQNIFGVFFYYCGGEGCWAEKINNLKFYDSNLEEITSEVVDLKSIEKLAKTTSLKNYNGEVINIEHQERAFFVKIPKKGTTISVITGYIGIVEGQCADLIFDKAKGKFNIIQK
jgi:hypothetical protein